MYSQNHIEQNKNRTGKLIPQKHKEDSFFCFLPSNLPPDPPINFDNELNRLIDEANISIGKLSLIEEIIPNKTLFIYILMTKESVLSSQIEGTISTLSNYFEYEADKEVYPQVEKKYLKTDIYDIENYLKAFEHGINEIKTPNKLPLCNKLIKNLHSILLENRHIPNSHIGEYRKIQVQIGGTKITNASYIPPAHKYIKECMDNLENFIHNEEVRPIIKAGIVHGQFEMIHPFLDGNGRIGRLLILLILCNEKVLNEPVLYLSFFFRKYREEYYKKLNAISKDGDWEGWLKFYLEGIKVSSNQAISVAKQINKLHQKSLQKIRQESTTKSSYSEQLLEKIFKYPIIDTNTIIKILNISKSSAFRVLKNFEELNILTEITNKQRGKKYYFKEYLDILNESLEIS